MPDRQSTGATFKSRFSLSLSTLFPSRHPPLVISHPRPPAPQYLPRHPIISDPSPVESSYPSPSPPLLPPTPARPKKRPPPLDMARIRTIYPSTPAVNELAARNSILESRRSSPPRISSIRAPSPPMEKERKKAKRESEASGFDDEAVTLEPPHQYPAWKGGKVDIRPGEVIPRHILPPPIPDSPPRRKRTRDVKSSMTTLTIPEQHYDSVLHNVLLTPTYLASTPSLAPSSSPSFKSHGMNEERSARKTLIDRATDTMGAAARGARQSRLLRGILKTDGAEDSMRRLREREAAEMDRFRREVAPLPLSTADSREGNDRVIRGERASRVRREEQEEESEDEERGRRGGEWITWNRSAEEGGKGHGWSDKASASQGEKGLMGWWTRRREAERKKKEAARLRRQRRIKIAIIILIGIFVALAVALSTYFLTRPRSSPDTASPATGNGTTTISISASSTSSASAPSTTTSRTLQACLDQFSALSNPASYPCSECVPLLTSTPNDFASPLDNGNSTGVGSALQFCALMDVYRATSGGNSSVLNSRQWAVNRDVCGWEGVRCNPRGMVTELGMTYPEVPDTLPSTLNNVISLSILRLRGNGTIPSGPFPAGVLTSALNTVDLQYTGLRGPIAQADWSKASELVTIYMANNTNLGVELPDLSRNGKLFTLAATGQGIKEIAPDRLPSSLTYLDLSYNAIGAQVPSFASLTSLRTLFMQNNALVLAPSSLPSPLVTLSLTGNANLSGNMASSICGNANMTSCDLRGTNLGGSTAAASSSASASASSTATSSSMPGAAPSGRVCGACRYS